MLKILVELHPFGDETKKRPIASMELWNDGTGKGEFGNYVGTAQVEGSVYNYTESRGGTVKDHLRYRPVWNLIAKMLHSMGYGQVD